MAERNGRAQTFVCSRQRSQAKSRHTSKSGFNCILTIRVLAFSENLNNVAHLQKGVIQPEAWSWGRRLAWIKLSLVTCKPTRVAMYHSHFSANSSLFSFCESLLKRFLKECKKHETTSNKLPSLRQNIITGSMGKTEPDKQQTVNARGAEAQRIGKMENARAYLGIFRDISAENVLTGFHIPLSFRNFLFFLLAARRF